jgi:hypothetical protein
MRRSCKPLMPALGRARRMDLAGNQRPGDAAGQPSKSRQMGLHHLRERVASTARWFVPVFERVELPKLRCVEIEPRHLSLIELEPGDCRYPYGGDEEDEPITFCGHPRREDASYCTAHFHLICGPDALPERCAALRHSGSWRKHENGITENSGRHHDATAESVAAPASRRAFAGADQPAIAGFDSRIRTHFVVV